MMKKACGVLVLVMSVLFLAEAACAIDLVACLGLKAGKWNRYQKMDQCGNQLADVGLKVASVVGGNFSWEHFTKETGSWVYEDHDIINYTSTKFNLVGYVDDNGTWLYKPTVAIPRYLAVNKPFFYKGSVVNQSTLATVPLTMTLIINESGVPVTTPAQSFTGCIKVLMGQVEGDGFQQNISFFCPGRGEVMAYKLKAKKTTNPSQPVNGSITTKTLKSYGNTNAPF